MANLSKGKDVKLQAYKILLEWKRYQKKMWDFNTLLFFNSVFLLLKKGGRALAEQHGLLDDGYFHHYQPIFDIETWKIIGFESYIRYNGFNDPERIFKKAIINKKLYEVDSGSIQKASETYIDAGYHSRYESLFLNVFPSTISNPLFDTFINKIINDNPIRSQQLILELNECEIYNPELLKEDVRKLKKMGIRIAIDDYGKGFSNFKTLIELEPDIIKLDKYFLESIKEFKRKKEAITFILKYCEVSNIKLIAEGVEDSISLAILKSLGVKFAQGHILGKPGLL